MQKMINILEKATVSVADRYDNYYGEKNVQVLLVNNMITLQTLRTMQLCHAKGIVEIEVNGLEVSVTLENRLHLHNQYPSFQIIEDVELEKFYKLFN